MSKGYWSLATIAARWNVSAETARAMLADCPRIKLRRAVRYSIEGVEEIEAEAMRCPGKPARRPRARSVAGDAERLESLRRQLGWV